jgi:hypothetical protein
VRQAIPPLKRASPFCASSPTALQPDCLIDGRLAGVTAGKGAIDKMR